MSKFTVVDVAEQDHLTKVALELIEKPLLFEDTIPPGCVQHAISSLMNNAGSKEVCHKIYNILCDIHMDDDTSRNKILLYIFISLLIKN